MKQKSWIGAVSAVVAITLAGGGLAQPANADDGSTGDSVDSSAAVAPVDVAADDDPAQVEFSQFLDALGVSNRDQHTLEERFAALDGEQRAQFVDDPASIIEFTEVESPPRMVAFGAMRAQAAAAVSVWEANNTQKAQVLGITVASFNLNFRYEATATKVTRILSCAGSFSGLGSGSSSASSYISSNSRGTCQVRHTVNMFFQGSPIQIAKLHQVTTDQNNPKRYSGSLTNP